MGRRTRRRTVRQNRTWALALVVIGCGGEATVDDPMMPGMMKPPPVPTIRTNISTVALDEGAGPSTVEVTLSAAPEMPVAVRAVSSDADAASVTPAFLSFTPDTFGTAQTFTITAADDADSSDEAVTISLEADGLATVTITVAVTDDEQQAFALNPSRLSVMEGRSTVLDVALGTPADQTVTITASDPTKISVDPSTLTFTAANARQPRPVTVTAAQDGDFADDALSLTVMAAGLSVEVPVSVIDDDTLNLAIDPMRLTLGEGSGPQSFSVSVTAEPTAPILAEISTTNIRAARVFPPSVQFNASNWMLSQAVSVVPVDDDNTTDEAVVVRLRIGGMPERQVAVTVVDDDQQSMNVSRTSLALTEGASGTFAVHLSHEPTPGLTVSIASSNSSAVTTSPSSLEFTFQDYATPKTVTVRARADADLADEAATLTLSGNGITSQTIAVGVTDDDSQRLVVSPDSVSVSEGRTATVAVSLAFRPASAVAVNVLSNSSMVASPSTARLVFAPNDYDRPQSVFLATTHDGDAEDEATVVSFTSSGVDPIDVGVTVRDDEQ